MDLNYIMEEFNTTVVNSMHCFSCLEEKEDRFCMLITLEDDSVLIPVCRECRIRFYTEGLDRDTLLSNTLYALENLEVKILKK